MICTISLLGSGKMEENKENDLQPPVPQSYAATVARQSTVPSTSTMPGKHHICPSLGRSHKTTWGKGVPRVHPGSSHVHCTLGQQDFGAHLVHPKPQKQGMSFLLCQLCCLCQAVPQTGPRHSRNRFLADSSCCQVVFRSCNHECRSQGSLFLW